VRGYAWREILYDGLADVRNPGSLRARAIDEPTTSPSSTTSTTSARLRRSSPRPTCGPSSRGAGAVPRRGGV